MLGSSSCPCLVLEKHKSIEHRNLRSIDQIAKHLALDGMLEGSELYVTLVGDNCLEFDARANDSVRGSEALLEAAAT